MLIFAHTGHWSSYLVTLVPTVAFIVWLVFNTWRERGRERAKRLAAPEGLRDQER